MVYIIIGLYDVEIDRKRIEHAEYQLFENEFS